MSSPLVSCSDTSQPGEHQKPGFSSSYSPVQSVAMYSVGAPLCQFWECLCHYVPPQLPPLYHLIQSPIAETPTGQTFNHGICTHICLV